MRVDGSPAVETVGAIAPREELAVVVAESVDGFQVGPIVRHANCLAVYRLKVSCRASESAKRAATCESTEPARRLIMMWVARSAPTDVSRHVSINHSHDASSRR